MRRKSDKEQNRLRVDLLKRHGKDKSERGGRRTETPSRAQEAGGRLRGLYAPHGEKNARAVVQKEVDHRV